MVQDESSMLILLILNERLRRYHLITLHVSIMGTRFEGITFGGKFSHDVLEEKGCGRLGWWWGWGGGGLKKKWHQFTLC